MTAFAPVRWTDANVPYDDELLLGMEAGTVAYLIRGRNAWHSTWVRHWFLNTHLFRDVANAKHGAESLRQRGNVFYIHEAPALVLRGPARAVVMCDHLETSPFGRFTGMKPVRRVERWGEWTEGLYPGVSLRDAVQSFAHDSGLWRGQTKSEYSMLLGEVRADFEFAPHAGKYLSLHSVSHGSRYFLGWNPSAAPRKFRADGTENVARAWDTAVSGAIENEPRRLSLAQSFVRHRDEILKVTPRTIGRAEALEAETRRREALSLAYQRWIGAYERAGQIEDDIAGAEDELEDAQVARLVLADTSAGLRAQRERVEAARQALEGLAVDLEVARRNEESSRRAYENLCAD